MPHYRYRAAAPLTALLLASSASAYEGTPVFTDKSEAATILARDDSYIEVLSPFDWAAKFRSNEPLDEAQRLAFMEPKLLEWPDSAIQKITNGVEALNAGLAELDINYPAEISFILTDGTEEGAPYTRGTYIVFPLMFVENVPQDQFNFVLAHEFFHVFSRHNQDLRPDMYALVGFTGADRIEYPDSIRDRILGNPDAPKRNYYFTTQYGNETVNFVPVTYASQDYDLSSNTPFFELAVQKLMAVEEIDGTLQPVLKDGEPLLVDLDAIPAYEAEITGGNTGYVTHPEEVLADNFALFVSQREIANQNLVNDLIALISRQ